MRKRNLKSLIFVPLLIGILAMEGIGQRNGVAVMANSDNETSEKEYEIYPTPQEITYEDGFITLTKRVNVYFESSIDIYTKNKLYDVLFINSRHIEFHFYMMFCP